MKQLEKEYRAKEWSLMSLYASTPHGAWHTTGAQQIFVARKNGHGWGEFEEMLLDIFSF